MGVIGRRTRLSALAPAPPISSTITITNLPTSGSVAQSGVAVTTITLVRLNYSGTVTLGVTGLPAGVTANFTNPTLSGATLTSDLQLTTSLSTPVATTALVITATGSGVTSSTCGYSLSVSAAAAGNHFFRPSSINIELPRGISPAYDVYYDEATGTLTPASPLWDWDDQRVGKARWAARTTTRTVVATGAAGWTEFLTYVAQYVAGSGDWEIRTPNLTLPNNGTNSWIVPTVTGNRRLYITGDTTLATTDVMSSISTLQAGCVTWTFPTGTVQDSYIAAKSSSTSKVTFTGINFVAPASSTILYMGLFELRNTSATTMADAPSGYVWDRCIWDATASTHVFCGITANGQQTAMVESYILGIRDGSNEAKAWRGYSCAKYQFFRNTLFEALSMGPLFGGADPASPGTGTCDPSDVLMVNTAATKYLPWMTENGGNAANGMKNSYESKNISRWFILNGLSLRNAGSGQNGSSPLLQSLQDNPDTNSAANINQDVLFLNHQIEDCPSGPAILSRVAYGSGIMPTHPSARLGFVNVFMKNIGTMWGSAGLQGCPVALYGDVKGFLFDQISWTQVLASPQQGFRFVRNYVGTSYASDITFTNMVGKNAGLIMDSGGLGLTALAQLTNGNPYTWNGNSFYGSSQYGGTITPGATVYASAAAQGFNNTTGALTAPGDDDGVGGSVPGVDFTKLNAAMAGVFSWAYQR